MNYLKLSVNNLKRQKLRTILSIVGILVIVMTFFSLYTFSNGYQDALNKEFSSFEIHIIAVPKGCPYEMTALILHGGEIENNLNMEQFKEIQNKEYVEIASPLVLKKITLNDGAVNSVLYGVKPNIAMLKPSWNGEELNFSNSDECYIGYNLFKNNNLDVGDEIVISGSKLLIIGVLPKTYTADDQFIYAPLETVQDVFSLGESISAVAIQLKPDEKIGLANQDISNIPDVQTVTFKQAKYTMDQLIKSTYNLLQTAMVFVLLLGMIGIIGSTFMGIEERQRELGMFKAIGANSKQLSLMIFIESSITLILGSISGIILALIVNTTAEYGLKMLINSAPAGQLSTYSLEIVFATVLFTLIFGLIATSVPVIAILRISPLEAIRNER